MSPNTEAGWSPTKYFLLGTAVFTTLLLDTSVLADDGVLDRSFGNDGLVLTREPGPDNATTYLNALIELANGQIVAAGATYVKEQEYVLLARFMEDGSPDESFGHGGFVVSGFSAAAVNGVIQLSSGPLIAVGHRGNDLAVWSFNDQGELDPTFGNGGEARYSLGQYASGVQLVEQSDGSLVIAATVRDNGVGIALVRLSASGEMDPGFGELGIRRLTPLGSDGREIARNLIADSAGNLFIAGRRIDDQELPVSLIVAKTDLNGNPDVSFGETGFVEVSLGESDESADPTAIALQADGKLVIAGGIGLETGWDFLYPSDGFVLRLLGNGTLDPGFGDAGILRNETPGWGHFEALATQDDGTILAAGFTSIVEASEKIGGDMVLMRFLQNGRLDTGFGYGGTAIADFGQGNAPPNSRPGAMIVHSSGRIVLAGRQNLGTGSNIALAGFASSDERYAGRIGPIRGRHDVAEAGIAVDIEVRRTGGSSGPVSIYYETMDDTAQDGVDYTGVNGVLEWPDGDASARLIRVNVLPDDIAEPTESFSLTLGGATGGAIPATAVTAVRILDDSAASGSNSPDAPEFDPVVGRSSGGGNPDPLWILSLLAAAVARTANQELPGAGRRQKLLARG